MGGRQAGREGNERTRKRIGLWGLRRHARLQLKTRTTASMCLQIQPRRCLLARAINSNPSSGVALST
eukprot:4418369-Prorocentrum_lima.AAC.1